MILWVYHLQRSRLNIPLLFLVGYQSTKEIIKQSTNKGPKVNLAFLAETTNSTKHKKRKWIFLFVLFLSLSFFWLYRKSLVISKLNHQRQRSTLYIKTTNYCNLYFICMRIPFPIPGRSPESVSGGHKTHDTTRHHIHCTVITKQEQLDCCDA